jgi:hypothetical protein
VALEKTFRDLMSLLRKLRDSLRVLQLTIREDLPAEGGVVLVDNFGDAVDDSLGYLEEALEAAIEARRALLPPLKWDVVTRALTTCQEHFHSVELRFQSELVSYERLKDLMAFGRSRRGEWLAWVKSVREGLEECNQPFDDASRALLACWQELAERAGAGSAAVQIANPGRPRAKAGRQLVHEGSP